MHIIIVEVLFLMFCTSSGSPPQYNPGKIQIKAKNSKNLCVHYGVQTADVTIISYKPLSGLNFARLAGHYCSCMPSSPLGFISP